MEDVLVPILVPLITFSMPVLLCWVYYRNEMHTTSQRTEIVKAVIEKNPDLDVEALLQKMNPKQKLLKEKLLSRLLWGCITGFIGLGLLIGSVFACYADHWRHLAGHRHRLYDYLLCGPKDACQGDGGRNP